MRVPSPFFRNIPIGKVTCCGEGFREMRLSSRVLMNELADIPFPELWDIIREEVPEMNPDIISWCDQCAGLVIPDRETLLSEYAPYGVPYTESRIFLGVVIFLLTRYGDDPCTLLKEAIQVGGDTDTVAAVVLGIALVRGREDSRIWDLVEGIEDGPYGREYVILIGNDLSEMYSESLINVTIISSM